MSYVIASLALFVICLVACFVAFWVGRGKLILEYRAHMRAREEVLDQLESSYNIDD